MLLTDEQKRMYYGELGPGMQKAMTMLIKYGEAFGAERMVRVDTCHAGAGPLGLLREMLDGVDRVRATTTLHAGSAGACRMNRALGLKEDFCQREEAINDKALKLCISKGFLPIMSCAPYLLGNIAKPGDVFSWPGSSGIVISNSLFGARGNRDAFGTTTAVAVTGYTPEMMLHKKENRRGQFLAKVRGLDLDNFTPADYGAVGYYIGAKAETKNVAIDGFPPHMDFEQLKHLFSPLPVSGAVSLCHVVGVTPEAPTLDEALGGQKPEEMITVGKKEYREGWEALHTAKKDDVQVVFFGCPHLTIGEIGKIARLLDGKKIADHVRLWVSTAELIYSLAKSMSYVDMIEKAGGMMVTDTCLMGFPYDQMVDKVNTAATNSARAASYTARRGINIQYGSTEQCIKAAIMGKWGG